MGYVILQNPFRTNSHIGSGILGLGENTLATVGTTPDTLLTEITLITLMFCEQTALGNIVQNESLGDGITILVAHDTLFLCLDLLGLREGTDGSSKILESGRGEIFFYLCHLLLTIHILRIFRYTLHVLRTGLEDIFVSNGNIKAFLLGSGDEVFYQLPRVIEHLARLELVVNTQTGLGKLMDKVRAKAKHHKALHGGLAVAALGLNPTLNEVAIHSTLDILAVDGNGMS